MKIGVVIQGPLVTYGDGPNNIPSGFSVFESIQSNVRLLAKEHIPCIVSTWLPRTTTEREVLIQLRKAKIPYTIHTPPQLIDPYNCYKQHLSILFGMKPLLKQKCQYIVKIRTDQVLPEAFYSWLKLYTQNHQKRLLVSELLKHHPFYLGDFIIGAEAHTFISYLKGILKHPQAIYFPLSAFDDGLKYLLETNRLIYNRYIPRWLYTYYLILFQHGLLSNIWNSFLRDKISVIPFSIWKEVIWRGKKMSVVVSPEAFQFTNVPAASLFGRLYFFSFLSVSYLRLWNKINKDTQSRIYPYSNLVFTGATILNNTIQSALARIRKKVILGRFACIGKEVLQLSEHSKKYRVSNQQKMRLDLFLDLIHSNKFPRTKLVKKFIPREDIFPLILEQENLPWTQQQGNIEYLLMDTFSELTDKKFTHSDEKWSICCHFGDSDKSDQFKATFKHEGLLATDQLYNTYFEFSEWFENFYPGKNIFVIHTPTALDSREIYKERATAITIALTQLSNEKPFVHNIILPASQIKKNQSDSFPYHFDTITYYAFLKKWTTIKKRND